MGRYSTIQTSYVHSIIVLYSKRKKTINGFRHRERKNDFLPLYFRTILFIYCSMSQKKNHSMAIYSTHMVFFLSNSSDSSLDTFFRALILLLICHTSFACLCVYLISFYLPFVQFASVCVWVYFVRAFLCVCACAHLSSYFCYFIGLLKT